MLYADTCIREGLDVPSLSGASMERLRRFVPTAGSIAGNPLDLWMTFQDKGCLAEVLGIGYRDPHIHMIIVDRLIPRKAFHMPDMPDSTTAVIDFIRGMRHRKPTIFTVESEGGDPDLAGKGSALRAEFCRAGIPAYPSLQRAARALVHLHRYHTRFDTQTPLSYTALTQKEPPDHL